MVLLVLKNKKLMIQHLKTSQSLDHICGNMAMPSQSAFLNAGCMFLRVIQLHNGVLTPSLLKSPWKNTGTPVNSLKSMMYQEVGGSMCVVPKVFLILLALLAWYRSIMEATWSKSIRSYSCGNLLVYCLSLKWVGKIQPRPC